MEHAYQHTNGIRLHYVAQGSGPLVLLLHGFPDFWRSWRHQIPALAAAGRRVIAVDLRGYNLSDRPPGVAAYQLDTLVEDIAGLLGALRSEPATTVGGMPSMPAGGQRPTVVGHDWGGIIAWQLAMHRSECVGSLVILNAPHPSAFRRELKRFSSQWLRSAYVGFFQLPKLPETLLSAWDGALLKRALRNGPAPTAVELNEYLPVLGAPGALTAALNYYRAAVRYPFAAPQPVRLPTLLLWGRRDPFLSPKLAEGLDPWVPDLDIVSLADAGHWLHHSHAEQVNQQVLAFLRRTWA